ncbi:MAG: uracil-DNA glycosylase family protein [Nanoarchaeota archaeon]
METQIHLTERTEKQEKEKILIKMMNDFMINNQYSKIIRYYGNVNSKIFILGEAPVSVHLNSTSKCVFAFDDESYDKKGRSGEVILKVFSDLNVKISDYFFDNAFKIPTEDLTEDEIQVHIDLLIKEINIVSPNKIICLGNDVFNIVKDLNLDYNIVKLQHPAYIIRNNYTNYAEYLEAWRKELKWT